MSQGGDGEKADFNPLEFNISGQFFLDGALYREPFMGRRQITQAKQMKMADGDVMVCTYPKAGTTWMQEIVYLIHNGADITEARSRSIDERCPYLEFQFPGTPSACDQLGAVDPPRLMKSHLPVGFLQHHVTDEAAKAIVVLRNPKDNLVSYYHFYRFMKPIDFPGSWNQFFQLVKSNQLLYGDYFDWVLGWWALRDHPRVKVVFYENLVRDPSGEIKAIAEFTGKTVDPSQLDRILEGTSFQSMKANPSTNREDSHVIRKDRGSFMRKGKVGDWVNYFTAEQSDYIDTLVKEKLTPAGVHFQFSADS